MNKKYIKLSESQFNKFITESVLTVLNELNVKSQLNENKSLLTESQESKSQSEAVKYLMNNLGWEHDRAYNFVRNDLRNDIPSLRDSKLAKFTLGVTRMFCNGQLNDASTISNLNSTLKLLLPRIIKYDRNLNNMSAQELISMFEQTRKENMESEKNEINSMEFSGQSNYEIVPINSYYEATKYKRFTNPKSPWCLTFDEVLYNSYTSSGINQMYFCLKNGFKKIKPVVGDNAPLDEYGLSMICVIVDEQGMLTTCTNRWNHENGGNDSVMNAKQLSDVLGVNFYQTFKPNNNWDKMITDLKRKLANGESPEYIFEFISKFHEGFARVELNGKWNFINQNGEIMSIDKWYDNAGNFINGFAKVELKKKYNFINHNGDLLSPNQWFDMAQPFDDGFAYVKLNGEWYDLDINGKLN